MNRIEYVVNSNRFQHKSKIKRATNYFMINFSLSNDYQVYQTISTYSSFTIILNLWHFIKGYLVNDILVDFFEWLLTFSLLVMKKTKKQLLVNDFSVLFGQLEKPTFTPK